MPSIIPGYEYDIFISYRQKDNKLDGWVTEFVNTLKNEIDATFKEDITIYFDENPHDGLHEHHEVDDSLKEKLKCLILIPIVSQTYCDPKCFAWEHEFKVFVEQAGNDQFGLKTKLTGGNVASRVLPIKIHDLDKEDEKLFESEVGGVMRSIDFIYKAAGVNRPLTPVDSPDKNLNQTYYRDQINKVANATKEVIASLSGNQSEENLKVDSASSSASRESSIPDFTKKKPTSEKRSSLKPLISNLGLILRKPLTKNLIIVGLVLALILMYSYPKYINNTNEIEGISKDKKQFHILFPEESPLALQGESASESTYFPAISLSPDGKVLCFVGISDGHSQLYLRYLNKTDIIPITDTEGAYYPFFSPDGKWIAYGQGNEIKKIMLPDGSPIDIAPVNNPLRGGAVWTESDEIIFSTNSAIYKVHSRGGDPELISSKGFDFLSFIGAEISITPDQKQILYNNFKGDVYSILLETKETSLLYQRGGGSPKYLTTGHLVFIRNHDLFAVPFDLQNKTRTGPENIIINGIRGTRNGPHLTYSNDGTLVHILGGYSQKSVFKWVDGNGNNKDLDIEPDIYGSFDLSPNGNLLAVGMLPPQDYLMVFDLITGQSTRIRVGGAKQLYSPVWGTDNESIIFGVRNDDHWSPYITNINEVGEPKPLEIKGIEEPEWWHYPYSWSESGDFLTLISGITRLYQGKNELEVTAGISGGSHMAFSPNDSYIVYASSESGSSEIYVQPFPATGTKWKLSVDGGTDPIWSKDGTRIYYHNNFRIYYVEVISEGELEYQVPKVYYSGRFLNAVSRSLAIDKDGKRLLILEPIRESQFAREAIVTLNWFDEIKRLAPVDK